MEASLDELDHHHAIVPREEGAGLSSAGVLGVGNTGKVHKVVGGGGITRVF